MSQNWYDKHDIKNQFGWSFKQFKTRLNNLEVALKEHYQGGNGRSYKVDNYALELLRRQYELELDDHEVSEASRMVIQEQKNRDKAGDREDVKAGQGELKTRIKYLKRENGLLRDRLEKQDNQMERLNNRIDNLLPAGQEDSQFKNKSLWQVIREWLKQPATG